MPTTPTDTFAQESEVLDARFEAPLRAIARRAVRVWFNRERLDRLLADILDVFGDCELVYAIDRNGRQVSSNVQRDSVDEAVYGQDLSRRPITVSLSSLGKGVERGAFLCDAYISQVTQRPCVTVMYRITSGPSLLGHIAADFEATNLVEVTES